MPSSKSASRLVTRTERRAIISASPEPRERDRANAATVAAAMEDALRRRGTAPVEAKLVAQIAAVVFETRACAGATLGDGRASWRVRDVAATIHDVVTGADDLAAESR